MVERSIGSQSQVSLMPTPMHQRLHQGGASEARTHASRASVVSISKPWSAKAS